MDECLFIRCMPYPYWLNMNQHQGSCTLRSSHMILLPCRLASSRPKLLTRPYVVEKREAGFERYGMATDASLSRTSAYSPVPHTSPSAPISVLFVCVCISVFAGWSQSLCFLCLSTGCRYLRSQMWALFAQDNSLCIWKQTTPPQKNLNKWRDLLWCVWAGSESFWRLLRQFLLCSLHSWSQVLDHKWLVLNIGRSSPDGSVIQSHLKYKWPYEITRAQFSVSGDIREVIVILEFGVSQFLYFYTEM